MGFQRSGVTFVFEVEGEKAEAIEALVTDRALAEKEYGSIGMGELESAGNALFVLDEKVKRQVLHAAEVIGRRSSSSPSRLDRDARSSP